MGMNSRRSKLAIVFAAGLAAIAASLPLHAQQNQGPSLGEVFDGVRGLFNRLLSPDAGPKEAGAPAARNPSPAAVQAPAAPAVRASTATAAVQATPDARVIGRSLHAAVVDGDFEETAKLLGQGANIEVKDPGSGASPLHYAVMKGRMKIIDLLLSRGADVNSRTKNGTTPLHTAALYARMEVAERLLEAHADINAKSLSGATPLALATAAKNWPLVDVLKAHGAK